MKAKPLIVMLCCLFMISLFASGMISDVDLTPSTTPAPKSTFDVIAPLRAPVSGAPSSRCTDPYQVQSGDTLSGIARLCGVALKDLIAANPSISNPNLIRPGQEVHIPAVIDASQATLQSSRAASTPTTAPPAATQAPAQPTGTALPSDGMRVVRPGDKVEIEIGGLPAQAKVRLALALQGGAMTTLGEGNADSSGVARLTVIVPDSAVPGQVWFVAAMLLQDPFSTVTSAPFLIGAAQ